MIQKLLRMTRIDEPTQTEVNVKEITNSDLWNDILGLFNHGMARESVGSRLLYPMSFYILMHKDDYEDRQKALPVLVQEIVKEFYNLIKQKEDEYQNVEPISKKWVFQFSPCQFDSSIESEDKDVFSVSRGKIISTCELYNDNIDHVEDLLIDRNIKVSIKCNNSNVIKTANLNLKALAGVDILEEGFYTIKFDESYIKTTIKEDSSRVLSPVRVDNKPFATLSYDTGSHIIKYPMNSPSISISGTNDTRRDPSIIKLESANLINSHVLIRLNDGKFEMCAFAETRKNEVPVPISEPGKPIWIPLADNSDILMNEEIQVKFNKL